VPDDLLPWSLAWESASSGPHGFYRRDTGRAEDHFATNVSDDTATARRILDIAGDRIERLLAETGSVSITDVGAGDGQLLRQLAALVPTSWTERLYWRGVDLRSRPGDLPEGTIWTHANVRDADVLQHPPAGLVIAHELLDDIPCDILEVDDDLRRRIVLVDPTSGAESLGPRLDDATSCLDQGIDPRPLIEWCERWWPRTEPAARVEVGVARDRTWRRIAGSLSAGIAVAVDYGHVLAERDEGRWDAGTLTAYRGGRCVSAIPDGASNITAHVAFDSCAASVSARTSRLERAPDGLWWLVHEMGR
jgi:SAM-dependent MidA family methyltransferase